MQRVVEIRKRTADLRGRLERLLLWRVWERMLEIEFVDRGVALAGKAFVSFFPLVIVIAAFVPERTRESMLRTITARFGMTGAALEITRDAFASANDIRAATGVFGLVLTILFAGSFATALQRVYLRAWRRPPRGGVGDSWRGPACLLAALVCIAVLGALRGALDDGARAVVFGLVGLAATTGLWWFNSWLLLRGEVRARVLLPTGVITSVALAGYAASATIWMPEAVTDNEAQFGSFGVALALVTWFSGAAICILVGACAGSVFAEDSGRVGSVIRAGDPRTLTPGAQPSLPAPARELSLRDAFRSTDER